MCLKSLATDVIFRTWIFTDMNFLEPFQTIATPQVSQADTFSGGFILKFSEQIISRATVNNCFWAFWYFFSKRFSCSSVFFLLLFLFEAIYGSFVICEKLLLVFRNLEVDGCQSHLHVMFKKLLFFYKFCDFFCKRHSLMNRPCYSNLCNTTAFKT